MTIWEEFVVVSLAAAESLLRRDFTGIRFEGYFTCYAMKLTNWIGECRSAIAEKYS